MIIVCMWCKTKYEYRYDDMRISYGLCEDCVCSNDFHMGMQLTEYLESLTQPVIAVNQDAVLLYANKKALQFIDKVNSDIAGQLCGHAFDCINTHNTNSCGKTSHCQDCKFIKMVKDTYTQNKMLIDTVVTMSKRHADIYDKYNMMLSTEKAGDVVLLRIDATLPFNSD